MRFFALLRSVVALRQREILQYALICFHQDLVVDRRGNVTFCLGFFHHAPVVFCVRQIECAGIPFYLFQSFSYLIPVGVYGLVDLVIKKVFEDLCFGAAVDLFTRILS